MRSARLCLAVACLAASVCTSAWAVQDCELNGESVNPANGNTTAGKTGLMRCKERDSGELVREQELRNGRFMGLVRYYDKGKLIREHSLNEKGNMEGRGREFGPAGQVLREGTYANGRTVGLLRTFDGETLTEVGAVIDVYCATGVSSPVCATTDPDAGSPDGDAGAEDAGVAIDAGTTEESGGCSCRAPSPAGGNELFAVFALVLFCVRRLRARAFLR